MKFLKVIAIILACLIITLIGGCYFVGKQKTSFQDSADIIRLQHLQSYHTLLDEYFQKTGNYPFQGKVEMPIYVFIANSEQADDIKGGPPGPHKTVSMTEFIAELEQVLGRSIDEMYDPQYAPDGKPNFYLYMINRDAWFLAVHLSKPLAGFSNQIGRNYHKLELSNHPSPSNRSSSAESVFGSEVFKRAANKPVNKANFFEERARMHRNDSKK